jgi:hypothetical protein
VTDSRTSEHIDTLREAHAKAMEEALEQIRNMATAAGAGEIPAMPIAKVARAALAAKEETP